MAAPKRLSKVAKELNVGISTIVDFLSEQGKDIDTSPNTKLDAEIYELLLDEFQADRGAKVKADEASRQKAEERKTITIDRAEEEAQLEAQKPISPKEKLTGPSVVGKIDLDKVDPAPKSEKEKEEKPTEIEKKEESAEKKEKEEKENQEKIDDEEREKSAKAAEEEEKNEE